MKKFDSIFFIGLLVIILICYCLSLAVVISEGGLEKTAPSDVMSPDDVVIEDAEGNNSTIWMVNDEGDIVETPVENASGTFSSD